MLTPSYGDRVFVPSSITVEVTGDHPNQDFIDSTAYAWTGTVLSGCNTVFYDRVDITVRSIEADTGSSQNCIVRDLVLWNGDSINEILPASLYRASITAIYTDGSGTNPDPVTILDMGADTTMMVDLRGGDVEQRFVYRKSNPTLIANEFGTDVPLCPTDTIRLVEQGRAYPVFFRLIEEYTFGGTTTTCELIPDSLENVVVRVTDPSSEVVGTIDVPLDSIGQAGYLLQPRIISFDEEASPDGPIFPSPSTPRRSFRPVNSRPFTISPLWWRVTVRITPPSPRSAPSCPA